MPVNWTLWRTLPQIKLMNIDEYEDVFCGDEFGITTDKERKRLQRLCIVHKVFTVYHRCDVLGWMIVEDHTSGCNLHHIAVRRDRRREGIGTHCIHWLKKRLEHNGRLRVVVDERNLGAQLFFRHNGLKAVNTIRNFGECADMYVMVSQ